MLLHSVVFLSSGLSCNCKNRSNDVLYSKNYHDHVKGSGNFYIWWVGSLSTNLWINVTTIRKVVKKWYCSCNQTSLWWVQWKKRKYYANTNTTTIKIQKSPQGEGYGLNHDTTYQRTTTQARSRLYYCTCSWVVKPHYFWYLTVSVL